MNSGSLRNKLDLYGKVESEDELGATKQVYQKIKTVFGNIIPANLSGSVSNGQANTLYANVTHRLKVRKLSIKNLTVDMYFKDKDGLRYDIEYFQPDYKNDDFWEIMLKIKYE